MSGTGDTDGENTAAASEFGGHRFDTVITGGHVIDPASGKDGRFDVAILDGRILSVEPELDAGKARRQIKADGQLVVPGLVDLHTHIYWGATYWGIEADPVAARTGVTTWLDVGSAGAYTFPGFREYIATPSDVRIYALLNLSSIGLVAPSWELANPDYWDVDLAAEMVERNRDLVLGIKARIDQRTTRGVGIEPLARARELADRVSLPLMTHIGTSPPGIEEVIPHLRPGDILTHCFTHQDMNIGDAAGIVRPEIKSLQQQGLILDVGHGTGSFGYEVAERMLEQGIMPDVISSDIHQLAVQGPMFDLPTTLSKFINLGMPLADVIACATINAARAVHLEDAGTLAPGSRADIALFRLESGDYRFYDVLMNERPGDSLLVNTMTIVGGHELARREERELHIWATVPEIQRNVTAPGVPAPNARPVETEALIEALYSETEPS
ncbi:MAG TPA: amidohydrolase/deacetylase family metallohydrolase [Thermomicrobiales bacterium]|nr:amidohydrolase/deacetylase family metallohydrolase [Thermomicrobiales bacterium]